MRRRLGKRQEGQTTSLTVAYKAPSMENCLQKGIIRHLVLLDTLHIYSILFYCLKFIFIFIFILLLELKQVKKQFISRFKLPFYSTCFN